MFLKSLVIIDGEDLDCKKFLKCINGVDLILFNSKYQWLKLTLLMIVGICLMGGLALFAFLSIYDVFRPTYGWMLISLLSLIPLFCLLIPALLLSYYYTFVLPRKIHRKISRFTDKNLPEMREWNDLPLTKNVVKYKSQCVIRNFCVATRMKKSERKLGKEYIVFKLPFGVPKDDFSLINSEGCLTEEFFHLWHSYVDGKETCFRIVPEPFAFAAIFSITETLEDDIVRRTMDELIYLPTKFNLITIPEEQWRLK